MARREKLWSFCTLLSSRGGNPDDMQRQIMVIPLTFSPFGDNCVRWHAKTNYGHYAPFCHPEAASPMTCGDKLWSFRTPFAIQIRSCSMAHGDKLWSLCAFHHPKAASLLTCGNTLWSSAPFVNREERIRRYQDDVGHSMLIIFKIFAGSAGGKIDRLNDVPLERN